MADTTPFTTPIPGVPPYWHRPFNAAEAERHLRLMCSLERATTPPQPAKAKEQKP